MRQGKESLRTLAQHLQLTLGEEGLDKAWSGGYLEVHGYL